MREALDEKNKTDIKEYMEQKEEMKQWDPEFYEQYYAYDLTEETAAGFVKVVEGVRTINSIDQGIMMIVMKEGMASVKSVKLILTMERSIITPTRKRALVVAADGIIMKRGEKKRATRKNRATVNEVSPVRPPSRMPVVLSTKVVTVFVPQMAPTVVPMASDIRARFSPWM